MIDTSSELFCSHEALVLSIDRFEELGMVKDTDADTKSNKGYATPSSS